MDRIKIDRSFVASVGKSGYCVASPRQETTNAALVRSAHGGKSVCRLKCGDPCVFGRAGEEAADNAEHGITLEFALNISVEGTANSDTSFTQQTVYQYLPIAIYSSDGSAAASQPAASTTSNGRAPGWGQTGK